MTTGSGRVIEIFTEATQLPVEERAAFLDRACAEDDELRRKIEALLSSNERAEGFLEQPPGIFDEARDKAAAWEKPGDTVDRYKLLQQIGEGGCGVVFLAEQQAPVLRRVALKVVKPGMDTRSVIARFEAERQALALMDHPNIAHVFDAGATESGRPYFVMELVEGVRITEYCDRHALSTSARLELFMRVCDAIQHAHQKGIIHRDIKPSNVLVATGTGGKPVPKVIDFGIAKATDGMQLTDKTILTAGEMLIGTPAYMSPEQAALSSAELDTRTDIYSLGVILYELLTGSTPFDTRELLKAGFDEVRRVILDKEPVRPSTRLSAMVSADRANVSKHHGAEAPRLVRELRGDLDLIVMKALEKDRTRRYATANGLAMDIGRYLSSEAILARPPSTWYQLRKLAKRNRLLFGGLSIFAVLFVIGFVAIALALTRERAAHSAEEKARREAVTDRTNSDEVTIFLQAILDGVGPSVAQGRDTKMLKEIVDQTAARLDVELTNQPLVQVKLRSKLGVVYRDLYQYPQSEAMLRETHAAAIRHFGEESEETADVLFQLSLTQYAQSNHAEAEAIMQRVLAMRQKMFGENHYKVAKCYEALGTMLMDRRQEPEAEAMLMKSLTMLRQLLGGNDPGMGAALTGLGRIFYNQGKYPEAEAMYRQALSNFKTVKDNDDPVMAMCMHNLADILAAQKKYDEAEALYRRSIAARRKVFGDNYALVARTLQDLSNLLNRTERFGEAEVTGREALAVARKVWGDPHERTVSVLHDLISVLRHQNKFEEIDRLFAEMLPPEGDSKPEGAGLLKERLNTNVRRSRWREAAADATLLIKHAPDDHGNYHTLAPLLVQLGEVAEYKKLCRTIFDKFSGTTDIAVADRMAKDCLILPSSGVDLKAVAAMADRAVAGGAESSNLPYFQFCKALAECRLGHHEEAVKWAGLAAGGKRSNLKAGAFAVMAMSRYKLNQLEEARKALSNCGSLVDEKMPKPEEDPGSEWREWVIVRALYAEAKQLVKGDDSSAARPGGEPR